jgi:hypothetical protein
VLGKQCPHGHDEWRLNSQQRWVCVVCPRLRGHSKRQHKTVEWLEMNAPSHPQLPDFLAARDKLAAAQAAFEAARLELYAARLEWDGLHWPSSGLA